MTGSRGMERASQGTVAAAPKSIRSIRSLGRAFSKLDSSGQNLAATIQNLT